MRLVLGTFNLRPREADSSKFGGSSNLDKKGKGKEKSGNTRFTRGFSTFRGTIPNMLENYFTCFDKLVLHLAGDYLE